MADLREFVVDEVALSAVFAELDGVLDERAWRLTTASLARVLGFGGITAVAAAAGVAPGTVRRGIAEIEAGRVEEAGGRVRRPGAGRRPVEEVSPGLREALDALVEPFTRGDPMCALRWTTRSLRKLAEELGRQAFAVSHVTVGSLLVSMGYSLQSNVRTEGEASSPDRDDQFRYIARLVGEFQAAGQPVVSIDCKKKEQVGDFANAGREWEPKGRPVRARDHDFPEPTVPKAVPFGVYDLTANDGWVTVGTSAETATFAVDTLRTWWERMGARRYPHARRLLVTCDAGGANGHRNRLFKKEIATLAARLGLEVTVCHFPPGTSKWNKIEHRMFSQITLNWRGRPLTSHEVVVNLIASTTTTSGLKIQAALDTNVYEKGIKVPSAEFDSLPIHRHLFHGDWNWTMSPTAQTD